MDILIAAISKIVTKLAKNKTKKSSLNAYNK